MPADLFDHAAAMDAERTIAVYERLRAVTPAATPREPEYSPSLRDLLDRFDALLLDGYGVLNIGPDAVPGAAELIDAASAAGVELVVLTNGASKPSSQAGARYRSIGLSISDDRVVSSRDALLRGMAEAEGPIGVVGRFCDCPDDDRFTRLDASDPDTWLTLRSIGFFGATGWDLSWQDCLEAALRHGVALHVANPDVAAPHPGAFSFEPGYWTAAALAALGEADVHWYGKPHRPVFDLALETLEATTGRTNWDRDRIAMVGDSLHTDILGGNAAGLRSVLITGHGLFRQGGAEQAMAMTGIRPDFITATV